MPRYLRLQSFCLGLLLLLAPLARAAEPPTEPILRIQTGMHNARITALAVDAAEEYLVTASDDKTVRVWGLRTGLLVRNLRPAIAEGAEGQMFAVAITPDGKTIACAGDAGWDWDKSQVVYFFDRASGRMIRRIAGLPNKVLRLAYSRDGRFLAAGLAGKNGVQVFNGADGKLLLDETYKGDCYSVDWDKNGRLLVSCDDGSLSLYGADLKYIATKATPGGNIPLFARFSPDATKVAVGYSNVPRVDVLSSQDLSLLFEADTRGGVEQGGAKSNLSKVAWSADGQSLYAGGIAYDRDVKGRFWIRRWSQGGRGDYRDLFPGADNTIMDLRALRDGGLAWASFDPAWGVLRANGEKRLIKEPAIGDFRDAGEAFQVASDAATIRFGYEYGGKAPTSFSIGARALQTLIAAGDKLSAPRLEAEGLKITDAFNAAGGDAKLNGASLGMRALSAAIAPANDAFVLGTLWTVSRFDRAGKKVWSAPAPGAAVAVNVTPDGKITLAAFTDGTIRWYRSSDGRELLNFFPHADRKRWVLWTPSGYYDASPGGEDLIGWHVNNGKDSAADFFPASRFRDRFYRPDIVGGVLQTLDESEAARLANEQSNRKETKAKVAQLLPPVITILSPQEGTEYSGDTLTLEYSVRTPSGDAVTAVRALVDGRPAAANRDLQKVATGEGAKRTITIPAPSRDSEVSLIAENKNGASQAVSVRLKWRGATAAEFSVKPKLYVLAIGVSRYANGDYNLQYAAKDARDFAAACATQQGVLYREVESKVLTDEQATRDNIADGLEWIERQTTAKDVAMVFLSGHGLNAPSGDYYFVPHNFDLESLKRTGIVFSDIKNTISNIAGKALFFVDSCHAGNVMGAGRSKAIPDINAVINELSSAENGAVVFSASTGKQLSWEDPQWNNGAFTKALVEGMGGKALANGRVTVKSLDFYISERVKELTKGTQTPTTQIPPTVPDFPIAAAK